MFTKAFFHDLAERVIATYVQAFIGFLVAAQVVDVSSVRVAALAAVPAALSIIKSLVAARFAPDAGASVAAIV